MEPKSSLPRRPSSYEELVDELDVAASEKVGRTSELEGERSVAFSQLSVRELAVGYGTSTG